MSSEARVEIAYDLLDKEHRQAIERSAQEFMKELESPQSRHDQTLSLRESVWPALGAYGVNSQNSSNYRLVVLPLSRFGAEQGFSGSNIVLGYFTHVEHEDLFPSQLMVIKLRKKDSKRFGELPELRDEMHRAEQMKPYASYYKDQYALPLYITDNLDNHQVLWSPFALTDHVKRSSSKIHLSNAPDLRQLLNLQKGMDPTRESLDRVLEVIKSTFRILEPLHQRDGTARVVSTSFQKEYEQYLRGFPTEPWGNIWKEIWGTGEKTEDFCVSRTNPIWVLNELMKRNQVPLKLGAVHGDLHPGNILYADAGTSLLGRPFLIDFGWAHDNSHIAKDYILLECNLRFAYFPANIDFDLMTRFARMNGRRDARPGDFPERFAKRVEMVQVIRNAFEKNRGADFDWVTEYVIPLFLVALGLLKFTHQYQNQIAARLTVLELADYIHREYINSR